MDNRVMIQTKNMSFTGKTIMQAFVSFTNTSQTPRIVPSTKHSID